MATESMSDDYLISGQYHQQAVRDYTQTLPEGGRPDPDDVGAMSALAKLSANKWKLHYPKHLRAELLAPIFDVAPLSQWGVRFLIELMYYESQPRGCMASLSAGKPFADPGTGAVLPQEQALAMVFRDLINGDGAFGDQNITLKGKICPCRFTPLADQNPGLKLAYLFEWFARVFAPLPRCTLLTDNNETYQFLQHLRRSTFEPLMEGLLALLDPRASVRSHTKFNRVFMARWRTISACKMAQTPLPQLEDVVFCILHGFTVSYNAAEKADGVDVHFAHRIVQFRNGAFLQPLWERAKSWSSRPERALEGLPTAENVPKLISNLLLSGALASLLPADRDSGLPGVPALADWEMFVAEFHMANVVKRTNLGAFPSKESAIDASALLLAATLTRCAAAAKVVFKRENLKATVQLFQESPLMRNSALSIWDGMATNDSDEYFAEMRFMRVPAKLEDIIVNTPNEGDELEVAGRKITFNNRTFAAASTMCKIIGGVENHPFLNSAGPRIFPVLKQAIAVCAERYGTSQWHTWQGILMEPKNAMRTLTALVNTTDNRLRVYENGALHDGALLLLAMYQTRKKEIERMKMMENGGKLEQQEPLVPTLEPDSDTDAPDAAANEETSADAAAFRSDPVPAAALTELTLEAHLDPEDVRHTLNFFMAMGSANPSEFKVLTDLERGFESDVDLLKILEYLGCSLGDPSVEADARVVAVQLQIQNGDKLSGPSIARSEDDGKSKHEVFISYAWASRALKTASNRAVKGLNQDTTYAGTQKLAVLLQQRLSMVGHSSFLDLKDMAITAGDTTEEKMIYNMAQAKYAILLIDVAYLASTPCQLEISQAIAGNKRLFPIFCSKGLSDKHLPKEVEASVKNSFYYMLDDGSLRYLSNPSADTTEQLDSIIAEIIKSIKNETGITQSNLTTRYEAKARARDLGTTGGGSGNASSSSSGSGGSGMSQQQILALFEAELGKPGSAVRRAIEAIVDQRMQAAAAAGDST